MRVSARNQGFTLIELLIVISLMTIITGATIPRFTGYIANQNLKQAQEQVKSDLRSAGIRALAGVGASDSNLNYWGARFITGSSRYNIISCLDTACTTPIKTQTSEKLPGDTIVKNPTTVTILFDTSKGNVTSSGSSTVVLGSPTGSSCMGVEVNSVGLVKKVTVECP